VKEHRRQWQADQPTLDLSKLVFLDESGAKTNMTRLRGRAKGGERVIDDAPCGHWCTTTMISSVRLDGSTACMAIDGATTGEVFREYVRHVLLPTLRPGDIVVMDNLSAHKDAEAIDLINGVGAEVRPLPPYSPDFNPIEKMWSKVKEFLRDAKARTQEALFTAIADALKTVTPQDAIGWFTSCGYMPTQQ
jgi:transposase